MKMFDIIKKLYLLLLTKYERIKYLALFCSDEKYEFFF